MNRTVSLPLLDRIHVATPCPARWEDMVGDDRVRRCAQCDLDVHDLSAMTRDEAESVLRKLATGRVCAQFYRRADGTVLTKDCPAGVARVRAAARRGVLKFAALIGLVGAAGIAAAETSQSTWGSRMRLRALKPFSVACEWIAPAAPPAPVGMVMTRGDVAVMPTPAPAPKAPNSGSGKGGANE
jgi:hypothetical protein